MTHIVSGVNVGVHSEQADGSGGKVSTDAKQESAEKVRVNADGTTIAEASTAVVATAEQNYQNQEAQTANIEVNAADAQKAAADVRAESQMEATEDDDDSDLM